MSDYENRVTVLERRIDGARIGHMQDDLHEVRTTLGRLEPIIIRIDAQLPHLATRAELGELRAEMHPEIGGLRAELAEKPFQSVSLARYDGLNHRIWLRIGRTGNS